MILIYIGDKGTPHPSFLTFAVLLLVSPAALLTCNIMALTLKRVKFPEKMYGLWFSMPMVCGSACQEVSPNVTLAPLTAEE